MIIIQNKQQILKNLLVMLGFGVFSIILGFLKFYIPGMDGGGSDMREIGVLLSALFLPSWVYMLGVSFIASFNFPFNNLEVSTILMHCTASLFAWFYYSYIKNRTKNLFLLGGQWALMVIAYYILFLIPTLIAVFYLFKVIDGDVLITTYKNILFNYRFEIFSSTAITTLFLVLYKTTRILEVKNKELVQALIKSEESDKLKTAFLSNINHEIRTPLNGIVGFTNLLTSPDISNEQRISYRSLINSSSEQLLSTISNIIELSTIKAGQVNINAEFVSIKELIDSIYLQYLPLAQSKNLLFEIITTEASTKDIIFTDRKILAQIIENLLNNAFKFTKKGFVRIYYKTMGNFTFFYIEDSGPGIAKRLHEKIFNPFSKFENEEDKFYEGIGLGLTIAKELAEILNGHIEITSEIEKGSVFSFGIPNTTNQHKIS